MAAIARRGSDARAKDFTNADDAQTLRAGIVKLYVEPRPGALVDIAMIRDVCEKALPAGAVPGEIEIRGSLPLTGSGEVLRSALRAPVPGRTRKETPA